MPEILEKGWAVEFGFADWYYGNHNEFMKIVSRLEAYIDCSNGFPRSNENVDLWDYSACRR